MRSPFSHHKPFSPPLSARFTLPSVFRRTVRASVLVRTVLQENLMGKTRALSNDGAFASSGQTEQRAEKPLRPKEGTTWYRTVNPRSLGATSYVVS